MRIQKKTSARKAMKVAAKKREAIAYQKRVDETLETLFKDIVRYARDISAPGKSTGVYWDGARPLVASLETALGMSTDAQIKEGEKLANYLIQAFADGQISESEGRKIAEKKKRFDGAMERRARAADKLSTASKKTAEVGMSDL